MAVSTIRAYAVTLAVLMTLTGCGDRKVNVFSGPDRSGTSGRTLTCTKKLDNGDCVQRTCKQSSENVAEFGVPFDCVEYAKDCLDAGEHWSGTKEGGTCTKVF